MAGSHVGNKLRKLLEESPPEARFTLADLKKHTGASSFTINYHMNALIKEKVAERIVKGVYARDQRFVSIEKKREMVDTHLSSQGSRIQSGENWQAGKPEAVSGVDLHYLVAKEAYAIQTHMLSIIQRIKLHPELFTESDIALLQRITFKAFPLSEQQKNVIDTEIKTSSNHSSRHEVKK